MAGIATDRIAEGRLDLVPMIDCIMLLLLFFMLTTRFVPEERVLKQLLPTTQGHLDTAPAVPAELSVVRVLITPAGVQRGGELAQSARSLDAWLRAQVAAAPRGILPAAELRVGNRSAVLPLAIADLAAIGSPAANPAVERLHAFLAAELAAYELPGRERSGQAPVEIHACSALSWQFALAAYDAVRGYEAQRDPASAPGRHGFSADQLGQAARPVRFAPPRVRAAHAWELGQELYEILHAR